MAQRYFRNTGNTAWGTGSNWSATDGGASVGAVPTSSDDVFFTALSGNVATSASIFALTINFTGYTGTWSGSNPLTVSGSVTLVSGMTINTTGGITINAAATLTSNGKIWPNAFQVSGAITATFADNWTIGGMFTSAGSAKVINGSTITLNGGLTMTGAMSGTTTIVLAGGTWSAAGVLSTNLNFAGNPTIGSNVIYSGNTIRYISGTPVVTGSNITINGSVIFNTNGMSFNQITINANATVTINSLLTLSTLTLTNATIAFDGTSGFDTGTFTVVSASAATYVFQLQSGVTYRIRTSLLLNVNPAINLKTIKSSTSGSMVNITLDVGATCNVGYYTFTDIDASAGRNITTFNGAVNNSLNILNYGDPLQSLSKTFGG